MLENRVHAAPVRWQVVEALAAHQNFAGTGTFKSGDDAQQRGFAGTAFAQDGEEFSLGDLQGNIAQDGILPERLGDIADGEQGRR